MTHKIAENGRVRVLAEKCPTCIFHPGNRMRLNKGRVRDMVADAEENESTIVCHSTLDLPQQACCRGFFDLGPTTAPLQIAERLDCIDYVELTDLTAAMSAKP